MNILILTPTHPVQIAEMINFISKYYTEDNDIFSVQSMALLGEETYNDENMKYLPLMYTYATVVRKQPKLMLRKERKGRKNIIIYGNLDRNTDMKFDHILAFSSMDNNPDNPQFDGYLEQSKDYNTVLESLKVKPIQWYTREDAHHQFPTLHHLEIMLKTLGVSKVVDDTVQQETTGSN
jgi:hypothetical protein